MNDAPQAELLVVVTTNATRDDARRIAHELCAAGYLCVAGGRGVGGLCGLGVGEPVRWLIG